MHRFILFLFPLPFPISPFHLFNLLNPIPLVDMSKAVHERFGPAHRTEEMLTPRTTAGTVV